MNVTSAGEQTFPFAAGLARARLAQLQESWELTHTAMTAAEAETVLAAHFES